MLPNASLVASEAIVASKQPLRFEENFEPRFDLYCLKNVQNYVHIASKGHAVASKAIAASKRPQGTDLTSELSSVTLITYVSMLLWPLNVSCDSIFPEGGDLPSIDLRGFATGKNSLSELGLPFLLR